MMKWLAGLAALLGLGIYGLYNCIFCADPVGRVRGAAGAAADAPVVVRIPSLQFQSLEPYTWAQQVVLAQGTLFEGLFGYDRNLDVVPRLAASWTLSPDRLTWTLRLRKDGRWSNGDTVTARDFIAGWARFCSPELNSPTWAGFYPHVPKAMDFKAGAAKLEEVGFRALDDTTLEIRTFKPVDLPGYLALASALPMHAKSLAAAKARGDADNWWMPEHFVGNGPYMPDPDKPFVRDGDMDLVRNPHYLGPRGNVDRFQLKAMNMSGQNTALQQFEADEIDVAHVMTLGDYAYATKARHLKDKVVVTPEIGLTAVQVARTVNKLMNDDNLRKAIALAIDKEDLAKNVMGGRVFPTGVYGPPDDPLFAGVVSDAPDRAKAKEYLAKSSYKGEPIYVFTPPSSDIRGLSSVAEALQSHLKAIGINAVIENMEEGMLSTYTWGAGYVDDARYTRPGITLFPGKVLWKTPLMMLRLSEHAWDWMNFDYDLKEIRKRLTLEKVAVKNERKGDQDAHWDELKALRDTVAAQYALVKATEKDSVYRDKTLEVDYAAQFDAIRASITPKVPKEERIERWQSAKDALLSGRFELTTHLMNTKNAEGKGIYARLETLTLQDSTVAPLLRRMVQLTLDQNWIIPVFSEKMVYVKRPYLTGETINKFGMWNMLFNLQYIEVDKEAYLAARGASSNRYAGSAP